MALQNPPFVNGMYFGPDVMGGRSARQFYDKTRPLVMQQPDVTGLVNEPLPGQRLHTAIAIGPKGIPQLGVPGGALLVLNGWDSAAAAEETFQTHIRPALEQLGILMPGQLDLPLLGCSANPDLDGFGSAAFASVTMWPDIGQPAGPIYAQVNDRLRRLPLPPGSGTHFTWGLGTNGIFMVELWRNQADFEEAMDEVIMPQVAAVFDGYNSKPPDPDTIHAEPLGLAVREQVRYYTSGD